MTTDDTARTLIEKARSGDREAFGALAERLRARLESQIAARMGPEVRARLSPEDVLQETLMVALRSVSRFAGTEEEPFYRWLAGIAEHVISNAARKKSWKAVRLDRDLPARGDSPTKAHRREERFDRLEQAIAGLSPDHREVLRLARIEGLTANEIAKRLGRTPNAVYKLLARGLEELRRTFGNTESLHLPDRSLRFTKGKGEGEGNDASQP